MSSPVITRNHRCHSEETLPPVAVRSHRGGGIVEPMPEEENGLSTLSDRPAAVPAVRRLRLLAPAGQVVADLASPRSSIGQQETNDVVLSDRTVSRFHCEILLDEGAARVR